MVTILALVLRVIAMGSSNAQREARIAYWAEETEWNGFYVDAFTEYASEFDAIFNSL